jgi:hypothetical protein
MKQASGGPDTVGDGHLLLPGGDEEEGRLTDLLVKRGFFCLPSEKMRWQPHALDKIGAAMKGLVSEGTYTHR